MFSKEVLVSNQVGLHARPATFSFKKPMNLNQVFGLKRMNAGLTPKACLVYCR